MECTLGKRKYHKHKVRDNKFGVTWCIHCGKLFNKPCGVNLTPQP